MRPDVCSIKTASPALFHVIIDVIFRLELLMEGGVGEQRSWILTTTAIKI